MSTPGGPSGDLLVDPAGLTAAAGILEGAAGSLADGAPLLRVQPDAGASTDEVAGALSALAGAVAAMATQVGASAESSRTSAADYSSTDQAVRGSMQQRGRSLAR